MTLKPNDVFVVGFRLHNPALVSMAKKRYNIPSHAKFRARTPAKFESCQEGSLDLVPRTVTVGLRPCRQQSGPDLAVSAIANSCMRSWLRFPRSGSARGEVCTSPAWLGRRRTQAKDVGRHGAEV